MRQSNTILTENDLYPLVRSELFRARANGATDRVGLEVELFPLRRDALTGAIVPVPFSPIDGRPALLPWLRDIAPRHGWAFLEEPDGAPTIHTSSGGTITLEPAGQVEYSGPPAPSAAEAVREIQAMVAMLDGEARDAGIELATIGYNNLCVPEAIELQVCKPRYRAMDEYFATIGPYGRMMMRATCALQINLDFGSDECAAERWRLANIVAPSLNAIFAHSPHEHAGRWYRSFRHEIWRRTDLSRTGRLYDRPDLDPVADYLRFALDATVMIVRDQEGNLTTPSTPMSFRQWLNGESRERHPDLDDWRLHLTTLFPDVRARGYIEVRSIDCLPVEWWGVPTAVVSTLLYDDAVRARALDLLESRERHACSSEHEHDGYWRSDFETGRELLELATPAIDDPGLATVSARFFERFTARDLTPADGVR